MTGNYIRVTMHPKTYVYEKADWMADHFGLGQYGVRFPDGLIFKESEHTWEFALDKKDESKAEVEVISGKNKEGRPTVMTNDVIRKLGGGSWL